MGEIVQFGDEARKDKEDSNVTGKSLSVWVWTCGGCGNSTFQLLLGGAIRCASCNLHSTDLMHFDPNEKK